jgi:hypothetical protein
VVGVRVDLRPGGAVVDGLFACAVNHVRHV